MLLISTPLLQDLFVERFDPLHVDGIEKKLVRAIDGRELAVT